MTETEIELALIWLRKLRISEAGHRYASVRADRFNYALGIPVVFLSTAAGTTVFANLTKQPILWVQIITGLVILFVACLGALQTFMGYSERSAKHINASARYEELKHAIEQVVMVADISSEEFKRTLMETTKEWGNLSKEAPNVPEDLWERAKQEIDRNEQYTTINCLKCRRPTNGGITMAWVRDDSKVIRDMINHESEVTNHRLTWLVTFHGLLFTALGFAWKDGRELIWLLAVLGIVTSLSILIPLGFASGASRNLVILWKKNKPQDYDGPPVIGHGPVCLLMSLFFPWFLLPVLLVVAWIVVAVLNYCRPV